MVYEEGFQTLTTASSVDQLPQVGAQALLGGVFALKTNSSRRFIVSQAFVELSATGFFYPIPSAVISPLLIPLRVCKFLSASAPPADRAKLDLFEPMLSG